MKLGILADIHEDLVYLRRALDVLRDHGADRLIVLGDVFELGHRLDATVELLDEVGAVGVWGNHDFGLCRDPHEDLRRRFSEKTMEFMGRLRPRLEVEGCLFVHVEPWLDPERIEDLWYFDDEPWYRGSTQEVGERLTRNFDATPHRLTFIGHYHRWLLATPQEILPWEGGGPVVLEPDRRHLVIVNAVVEGWCALFDTETNRLLPFDLRERLLGPET
jgi:Calcineurin-like phosphoesterase superfamily domain